MLKRTCGLFLAALAVPAVHAETVDLAHPHIISKLVSVEDAVAINDDWVVGSSYSMTNAPTGFYLFNARTKAFETIKGGIASRFDRKAFPTCPGAPDFKTLSTHGVDYYPERKRLYLVNHGGRESVEVFDVALTGGKPHFTWVGCAVAPANTYPDAVAGLADGGMIVTSLWNPNDPTRNDKMKAAAPLGGVFKWSPVAGWSTVPGTADFSGPNGVLATRDGKTIYVNLYAGKQVARVDLSGGHATVRLASVPYLADNIRWNSRGTAIYVGGQAESLDTMFKCYAAPFPGCKTIKFQINLLDPKTMTMSVVVPAGTYQGMSAGTGAIDLNKELWVTSFKDDDIAIFPITG
ncbi:SMP-30/gluconolactonase/LRE family protein [Sphingomonas abietis]|uniref:SMP-30/Gluconolactonase/LRE-like region domain-containing protein n=1 Tax=Sphingomonas abietis TaxID=3012344 RepID=A0ABY7NLI0_9SPHN|nr:hypothetical protein [Sphingomonas abietis]WBO21331.1 hypothetical protein PBT88_14200 [Sphingomonas abietis]